MATVNMVAIYAKGKKKPWVVAVTEEIARDQAEYNYGVNDETKGFRVAKVKVIETK